MSQFTFRTAPPATYISPSHEEMKEGAKQVGLKGFSKDLVADLCNLAAGGAICPPSKYRDQVWARTEQSLSAPNANGNWSYPRRNDEGKKISDGATQNRMVVVNGRAEEAMRYHQNVCDFLQTVDLSRFPGGTPLEQAMSLLKLLSKQTGGEGGGEAGEPLPIFVDSERPEGVAEDLHETLDMVDSLTQEEQDMLDPDGKNHEIEDSSEGDGQRTGNQQLNKLKVAEDLVEGADKRVMLDVSRKLDEFSKLHVTKQVKLEQDPAGEEIRQRPIAHLGELGRVNKSAWALRQQSPIYFLYQAVTHQLPVRERVTRRTKKQAIFILVDGSGSMRGKKHWKATGVVMSRLKAVLSGDAEVWISVFDTALGRVEHAATPDEARALIKKFAAGNFTGGGTDIAAAARSAGKFMDEKIAAGEALYRPEIVVLTDDDTSVASLKKSEFVGTRLHGFAMEVANKSLVDFARSTGGVGIDKF